jgi:hypothetical protein
VLPHKCTDLISSLLATKARPLKALAASRRVRMVWWGFRELKTSERAFSIADAVRRQVELPTIAELTAVRLHPDRKAMAK